VSGAAKPDAGRIGRRDFRSSMSRAVTGQVIWSSRASTTEKSFGEWPSSPERHVPISSCSPAPGSLSIFTRKHHPLGRGGLHRRSHAARCSLGRVLHSLLWLVLISMQSKSATLAPCRTTRPRRPGKIPNPLKVLSEPTPKQPLTVARCACCSAWARLIAKVDLLKPTESSPPEIDLPVTICLSLSACHVELLRRHPPSPGPLRRGRPAAGSRLTGGRPSCDEAPGTLVGRRSAEWLRRFRAVVFTPMIMQRETIGAGDPLVLVPGGSRVGSAGRVTRKHSPRSTASPAPASQRGPGSSRRTRI